MLGNSCLILLSDVFRTTVIYKGRVSKWLTLETMCFSFQIWFCLLLVLTGCGQRTFSFRDFENSVQGHPCSFPWQQLRHGVSVSFYISPSSADLAPTATCIPPAHYISIKHSLLLQSPTHPTMLGLLGSQKEEIFM